MANYATLIAAIQEVIKTNGNEEITGALLQQSLLAMINSLGDNFQFRGVAYAATNPGTPDQNVFYISGSGTYPNFNNTTVPDGYMGVFKYNGSWVIETLQVGKNYDSDISELNNKIINLDNINYVKDGLTATKTLRLLYGNVIFYPEISLLKDVTYNITFSLQASQSASVNFQILNANGTVLKTVNIVSGQTTGSLVWMPGVDYYNCVIRSVCYFTPTTDATVTVLANSNETQLWRGDSPRIEEIERVVFGKIATFVYSAAATYQYNFLANRQYKITNISSAAQRTITIRETENGSAVKTLYLSQGVSQTVILDAQAYYIRSGGACTLTIELVDDIIDVQDAEKVKVLSLQDVIFGVIRTVTLRASTKTAFQTLAGQRYVFTNKGTQALTFTIWENSTDTTAITSFTLNPGVPKEYLPTVTGNYIQSGLAVNIQIQTGYSVDEKILQENDNLRQWVGNSDYTFSKEIAYSSGATISVNYPFKNGRLYNVNFKTSTSGAQLVIYFGADSYMTFTTWPGQKEIKFIPPKDYETFRFYCGTQLQAGTATLEIDYIKDIISNDDFQFGVGINCKYDTPDQPAFTVPTESNRPSYFYNLFDGLVSLYPNYVTKIDCDAIANAAGIETPAYMDGCPIYMYKFIPTFTPDSTSGSESSRTKLKVMIIGGTHPELTAIQDLYNTMKLICESWQNDDNLGALRWDVELYVIPCEGAYVVKTYTRTNYNGVDLNRNMPTSDWRESGAGTNQYTGPTAGSEYETKVLIQQYDLIKPHIFIDHHNANAGEGKNMVYITTKRQKGVDIGAAHISLMTRRWKQRFSTFMPQDDTTIFGYSKITPEYGTRAGWACEQGALGFTYESNEQIYYQSGANTANVMTIATDGFLNFLLRVCKSFCEYNI